MALIHELCTSIFNDIWKHADYAYQPGNVYSGYENWPTITFYYMTMGIKWRNRYRKTLDGTVWIDGKLLFSYVFQLETFNKYTGKIQTEKNLMIIPHKNDIILYMTLLYTGGKLDLKRFARDYELYFKDEISGQITDINIEDLFEF